VRLPFKAGATLSKDDWCEVRHESIFECCKWDIQPEDHSVLAPFPILLEESHWRDLAKYSGAVSREALEAENELLRRPELHATPGIPSRIQKILRRSREHSTSAPAPRIMRFDFHFTREGWRISEVNADVPGGFIEASGFTKIMAGYFPETVPLDPAGALAEAI
jgi:hypothetical protein